LSEFFPLDYVSQIYNFEIISEPDTYFVHSAFTLAACVIAKRETEHSAEQRERHKANWPAGENENRVERSKSFMYYLNDGVYASCISMATQFNSMPTPKLVYIASRSADEIMQAFPGVPLL
jgi:hypothetical protein